MNSVRAQEIEKALADLVEFETACRKRLLSTRVDFKGHTVEVEFQRQELIDAARHALRPGWMP